MTLCLRASNILTINITSLLATVVVVIVIVVVVVVVVGCMK